MNTSPILQRPLSIAPMVDWSNTHFRMLMRYLAPHALVYTEMEPLGAVLNRRPKALCFDPLEHPIALQVGGANASQLVEVVKIAQEAQFDELNLNLGCPSHKVLSGHFGACLMREGEHVAACVRAMKAIATLPITIKMRTGVDALDSYDFFADLAGRLIEAGADKLIIHARKAWLHGLNPKQNRTLPPLQYDYVYRLKQAHPSTPIIINGHLDNLQVIQTVMPHVDGIMIGRLACHAPYALTAIHQYFYPSVPIQPREAILQTYLNYAYHQAQQGVRLSVLGKPIMNMLHGLPYAKRWKQALLHVIQQKRPEGFLELCESYDRLMS